MTSVMQTWKDVCKEIERLAAENADLRTKLDAKHCKYDNCWLHGKNPWKLRWDKLKCYIFLNLGMPQWDLIRSKMHELESGGEVPVSGVSDSSGTPKPDIDMGKKEKDQNSRR